MLIIKAPDDIMEREAVSTTVFLAGSIGLGKAENWQDGACNALDDYSDDELTVFNPRRDNFNAGLKQTAEEPELVEQIEWELEAMEESDYILMYFHPDTQAPITMMELGLHADSICKVVAVCPDGFWRQGNVEIVCRKYDIPFFKDLDEGINQIRGYINYDNGICNRR